MQSFRRRLSISFPALFVLSACGAPVNVGGPQDSPGADGGSAEAAGPKTEAGSPSSSSGSSGSPSSSSASVTAACSAAHGTCIPAASSCDAPQDPSLMNACGDPSVLTCCVPYVGPPPSTATADPTGLTKARAYASGNAACMTDADCCVVFDACVNQALVVGLADKDKVATLIAGFEAWVQSPSGGPAARCTGCIPPPVQLSCVQQKCTGLELNIDDFKNPMSNPWVPWMSNHCGAIPGAPAPRFTGSMLGCGAPPPSDAGTQVGTDAGNRFACGPTTCDKTTQYCFGAVGGISPDSYRCQSLPAACATAPTCACFMTNGVVFDHCTDPLGAVTVTRQVG
jgi:hypothetical protein